jgi:HEAT repeat protein
MPPWLKLLVFATALLLPSATSAQQPIASEITNAIHQLNDRDPHVRRNAAEFLGNQASSTPAPDERQAVPPLVAALKDPDSDVRFAAAFALGNVGSDGKTVIPALVAALDDVSDRVREEATSSLGRIHQEPQLTVPALATALTDKSDDVRMAAETALIQFGPDARVSMPTFINLLKNEDSVHRLRAAKVLAAIGPAARDAVPQLTAELADQDAEVRLEAAGALARIGVNQSQALPIAVHLLHHDDWQVRFRAAAIIGDFGAAAESAVPALTENLDDPDADVRRVTAAALDRVAVALRQTRATPATESLQAANAAMQQSSDSTVRSHADNVSDAVAALETIRRRSLKERLLRPVQRHPTIALVLAVYIALAFLCGGLLWLTPLSVLRINEALKTFPMIKLPGSLGGIEISLPNLLLIGFFHYHARVLEAWVRRNIDPARAAFESFSEPEINAGSLELPVSLDGTRLPAALSAQDMRAAFARPRTCIVICGEDKPARTRLAHQIGHWATERNAAHRIQPRLMLPVFLNEDFAYASTNTSDALMRTVRDKLQFEGPPPSLGLVEHLLGARFVLVLIDGLSELSEATQSAIRPDSSDFQAHALVVTSRTDLRFGDIHKTTIKLTDDAADDAASLPVMP